MTLKFLKAIAFAGTVALTACSTVPTTTPTLDEARADFVAANNNPQIATYAPMEFKQAGEALDRANQAAASKESLDTIDRLAYVAKQRIATAQEVAKAKSATVLLRMDPDDIVSDVTRNWSVSGIVAYSKICTHVGCPISLNERTTHHLLCPCHQSTFDLADSGKVIFGPAARSLPQLPITVNADGYLVAKSGFDQPVGPSFWERG